MVSDSSSSEKSDQDDEHSSSSLLSILDDKNKLIASLQEQLKNQKLQLKYYLEEKLNEDDMKKYSRTCLSEAGEDNIAVNMEITNFYRKNGVPSKLKTMYDSMTFTENKIRSLMNLQEKVLKMILSKIMQSKIEEPQCLSIEFLRKYPGQFSLVYSMYQINTQLYKELKCFRSSCNRLISVEEERNSIAEEICSMPSEEKRERRSILLLNDEKIILQTEIKELRGQKEDLLENKKHLEEGYEYTYENLNEMLEAVNEEAANLLQTSLQQKQVFQSDLNNLRQENEELKHKLRKMMNIVQSKQDFDVKIKKMEDLCLNSIQENMYHQKKQKQKWKKEVRMLRKKTESVTLERDSLRRRLGKVKEKLEAQMKEEWSKQLEGIAQELDVYKTKYDRLTYVQEAYNEVSEQNMLLKEIDAAKENKICELKESHDNLQEKIKKQSDLSEFMQKQIKNLLIVIYLLGRNVTRQNTCQENGDNALLNTKVDRPTSPIKGFTRADNELGFLPIQNQQVFVGITNARPTKILAFPETTQLDKETFKELPILSNKLVKSTPALEKLQQIISQYGDLVQQTREVKSEPKTFETNSSASSNTLHSESSRVQVGSLQENRLHSTLETKHFNSETTTTLGSQNEGKRLKIKESELMKDCSNESIQQYYKSVNKRVEGTQISKESLMRFLQKCSKETTTSGYLTSAINIQTKPNVVDKSTSSEVLEMHAVSSQYQQEKGTENSEETKLQFKVESQSSLIELGLQEEGTKFLGGDCELPKTPLEQFLENETFPSHILQIKESDLVTRLQNMSSKLDQTLSNSEMSEVNLFNNIRCVFDTLFSCDSFYANT